MKTPCEKNLGRDKECTTNAEDTQNQHYQRVRTVVDSFLKLFLVLEFTGMAGVYTHHLVLGPRRESIKK